jgi:hypothetical protein
MTGSTFVQEPSPGYRDGHDILDGVYRRVCWPKRGFGTIIHEGTDSGTLSLLQHAGEVAREPNPVPDYASSSAKPTVASAC